MFFFNCLLPGIMFFFRFLIYNLRCAPIVYWLIDTALLKNFFSTIFFLYGAYLGTLGSKGLNCSK